ncbi:uncharacterized protein LOC116256697 isoform X2 [Nymphaea colorata]|uniref:uncharacterized protein LOC116256697 isoform X2 n=1 Tax=Nymphaea colorata TaxID=210225 RepID=UPI00129E6AB3|nr:uncharacterized protein LOC116256697 isoform X2 [Nymphaea colorata]
MGDVKFPKGSPVMGPLMRKQRKKQVKDELDRLKLAEKKKRRLEKALAASAAIRSELEKKKQKKKEEQQRLDEEGAAIAEAVALHVLMEEKSEDSCLSDKEEPFLVQKSPSVSASVFPAPCNASSSTNCWDNVYCMGGSLVSESFRDLHLYGRISGAPENCLWNPTSYCDIFQVAEISGIVASQAIASLKIAEDVCSASLTAPDTVKKNRCLW